MTAESNNAQPAFTLKQRIVIWLATWAGYLLIKGIGPTLRFQLSIEDGGPTDVEPPHGIYVFWHRALIPVAYRFRNRGIAVMTSSSFDGEYIARIIEKLGYKAIRGSSTRGGIEALLGLHKLIAKGTTVGFTIDGPRGPIYVAKPGPVLLARNTQVPIMPFYVAAEDGWVFNSWDRFVIPKPFSRVHLRVGRFVHVPRDADSDQIRQLHEEMQGSLDRARQFAEEQFPQANTLARN